MDRDMYYSVPEAARILQVSPTRIRQLIQSGAIEAEKQSGEWAVLKPSFHAFYESYEPRALKAAVRPTDLRDIIERAERLQRELGRLEGKIELTDTTESTLREQLEREQQRADKYEAQLQEIRQELEEARRPWWRKMFN
jgi:septal ring factor EnvC (AmiA/AmiB activator)